MDARSQKSREDKPVTATQMVTDIAEMTAVPNLLCVHRISDVTACLLPKRRRFPHPLNLGWAVAGFVHLNESERPVCQPRAPGNRRSSVILLSRDPAQLP